MPKIYILRLLNLWYTSSECHDISCTTNTDGVSDNRGQMLFLSSNHFGSLHTLRISKGRRGRNGHVSFSHLLILPRDQRTWWWRLLQQKQMQPHWLYSNSLVNLRQLLFAYNSAGTARSTLFRAACKIDSCKYDLDYKQSTN